MTSIIRIPWSVQRRIDAATLALLHQPNLPPIDFGRPLNEPALIGADSVSWRVFKNPVALFVGGIAAVILELADVAVRSGVWEHSTFRKDPVSRIRRTGLAAMVTIYAARSKAEPMIAAVARRHAAVEGETPNGTHYRASDPRLLTWVHATAAFSFARAYSVYVEALSDREVDDIYRESTRASRLYGALGAPQSKAEMSAMLESAHGQLESSAIVFEFLRIMDRAPALPRPLRWLQPILVRAAVEIVPDWIRQRLSLGPRFGLRAGESWIVRLAGKLSDRIVLPQGPAVQSCIRLGLPNDYLYLGR
jgi:uncharacterized protein (DUF2236 family)